MSDTLANVPNKAPNRWALLPWLFIISGNAIDVAKGEPPLPWLAAAGLFVFAVCYSGTIALGFDERRHSRLARALLITEAVVTYPLAIGYGSEWTHCFLLLAISAGVTLRGTERALGVTMIIFAGSAGAITGIFGDGGDAALMGYGTLLSGVVVAMIISLFEAVRQLRDTREELARGAVERERLRFSRDLHDLLGHTLSVVVVKAEAVRRLAPRDLDAALGQAADIEAVGRQALTEIREAVSGYREGSLTTELDRARSLLDASGIDTRITQSGPPLPPQTEALLGWVVREGVTNVVRHSGAATCSVEVRGKPDGVHLEITDDGRGPAASPDTARGTGLKGLAERLAAAGGSLTSGSAGRRGYRLVAELPVDAEEDAADDRSASTRSRTENRTQEARTA
ncbi:sensor histidine kinase [Streptomyces sp. NPDC050617]|uniref:sensor histidine kinase n=1 Tax=Streptomyces sp. NPDC050617 TaxID=3154628 RepID=UPI003427D80F